MSSNPDIFYTFEFDGERHDLECATKKEAEAWADEWVSNRWDDEPMRNGETREDEGFIIKFTHDDDGEFKELEREKYSLYYEYYHGDFKEHNTLGR